MTTESAAPKPLPTKAPEGLRTFTLSRQADSSGVSGTGVVMQGVQFATGRVVVQWLTPFPGGSVNIFDSLDQLLSIHVHSHPDNGTTLTFSDGQVIEA